MILKCITAFLFVFIFLSCIYGMILALYEEIKRNIGGKKR